MRKIITSRKMLRLLKAATILSIGGLVAGCSSDVIRFSDGFYTGAIPQQAEVQAQSPASYGQPNYNPNLDQATTGSIASQSVQRAALPRPSEGAQAPTPHPATPVAATARAASPASSAPANVSPMTTASIAPEPSRFGNKSAPASTTSKEGWSTAGGTQVTMREGETLYNLSRRYGVPANAIMEANGISDP